MNTKEISKFVDEVGVAFGSNGMELFEICSLICRAWDRLHGAINVYIAMIEQESQALKHMFSENEFLLLCDIHCGTSYEGILRQEKLDLNNLPLHFTVNLEDALESYADFYPKKWHVDGSELLTKVCALNGLQTVALIDAIERFAMCSNNSDMDDPLSLFDHTEGSLSGDVLCRLECVVQNTMAEPAGEWQRI